MPYCPKCGVELEYGVKNCPLCEFPIPDIEHIPTYIPKRYPKAQNNHPENIRHIKNTVFITLSVLFLTTSFLLLFFDKTVSGVLDWSLITASSLFTIEMMLIAFMGYSKSFTFSLSINLLSVLLLLWTINQNINDTSWFFSISWPLAVLFAFMIWLLEKIFRKINDKGLNIAGISLIAISVYCICSDALISYYLIGNIHIWWSIITAIAILPASLLLLYLHYGLPDKYKEWFYKNFHF